MKHSHNDYRKPGALKRLSGETWEDFSERQRASQAEGKHVVKMARKTSRRFIRETYETRMDDLGASPDY